MKPLARTLLIAALGLLPVALQAQGSLPSFTHASGDAAYTVMGNDPAKGGTADVPVTIVPLSLSFEGSKAVVLNAGADVAKIERSPIFAKYSFSTGTTQYADALLRASFYKTAEAANTLADWHTLLKNPSVAPALKIEIPALAIRSATNALAAAWLL